MPRPGSPNRTRRARLRRSPWLLRPSSRRPGLHPALRASAVSAASRPRRATATVRSASRHSSSACGVVAEAPCLSSVVMSLLHRAAGVEDAGERGPGGPHRRGTMSRAGGLDWTTERAALGYDVGSTSATTRYLRCATPGASMVRSSSSSTSGPTPAKRRAPPPRMIGVTCSSSSSTRPAARYWLMTSAPPPMKTSLSPAAARARSSADSIPSVTKVYVVSERTSGSRSWWVRTKTGLWNGGSSPHQPCHGSSPQGPRVAGPNLPRPMISAPTFACSSATTALLTFSSPPSSPLGSRHAFSLTSQSCSRSPPSPSGSSWLWFGPAT